MIYRGKPDVFRESTRGKYETNLCILNSGSIFPSAEIIDRSKVYAYRERQFNGLYSKGKMLKVKVGANHKNIPYPIISVNRFALATNKLVDMIVNNGLTIKTGDKDRDIVCEKILERYDVLREFKRAFTYMCTYGDSPIKAYKGGITAFKPFNCFKVVDEHNVHNVLAYVLFEYLYDDSDSIYSTHIRFEIHMKGKIYEVVKKYSGSILNKSSIGKSVEYKYKDRVIPAEGNWYETGIDDCACVQWLTFNADVDGVYGQSLYQDFEGIVYAHEIRLSSEYSALDSLLEPILIVGMSMVTQNQETGGYELKLTNTEGNIDILVEASGEAGHIKSFQQNFENESNERMMDRLDALFYEMCEMSKVYMTAEYKGSISEETMNNQIKGAIDKSARYIIENMPQLKKSLYCLFRLNGIDIDIEDLTLSFNVGRIDDMKSIGEIVKVFVDSGVLSKFTCRTDFLGYTDAQSEEEEQRITNEKQMGVLLYNNNKKDNNELEDGTLWQNKEEQQQLENS